VLPDHLCWTSHRDFMEVRSAIGSCLKMKIGTTTWKDSGIGISITNLNVQDTRNGVLPTWPAITTAAKETIATMTHPDPRPLLVPRGQPGTCP
jgi:hypothetical protein